MALKRKLTTAPPAEIANHYKKISDQEWVLDLDGEEEESPKVKEFRETSIKERQRAESLEKELATERERLKQAAPKEEENKTLSQQVAQLTKKFEEQSQAREKAEQHARQEGFRSQFMGVATKHKVRDDNAAKVLHSLASLTFKEKEGKFVPLDEGGNIIYSKKIAASPLSLEEWVEERKTSDYKDLFSQPTGGSARGSNGATGGTATIRITREQANTPTKEQMDAIATGKAEIID